MIIIGITAPIGCGKSYVASIFEKHGVPTVDSDLVYHSMVSKPSPTVKKLAEEFGKEILAPDGSLDRKKLAPIVFSDPLKLNKLNEITHIAVTKELSDILSDYEAMGTKLITVQVPLMFESGFDKKCDIVICVAADESIRLERICKRDTCTVEQAQKKINNQKDIQFYIANSFETVYNNGNEDLDEQISRILDKLSRSEEV